MHPAGLAAFRRDLCLLMNLTSSRASPIPRCGPRFLPQTHHRGRGFSCRWTRVPCGPMAGPNSTCRLLASVHSKAGCHSSSFLFFVFLALFGNNPIFTENWQEQKRRPEHLRPLALTHPRGLCVYPPSLHTGLFLRVSWGLPRRDVSVSKSGRGQVSRLLCLRVPLWPLVPVSLRGVCQPSCTCPPLLHGSSPQPPFLCLLQH